MIFLFSSVQEQLYPGSLGAPQIYSEISLYWCKRQYSYACIFNSDDKTCEINNCKKKIQKYWTVNVYGSRVYYVVENYSTCNVSPRHWERVFIVTVRSIPDQIRWDKNHWTPTVDTYKRFFLCSTVRDLKLKLIIHVFFPFLICILTCVP